MAMAGSAGGPVPNGDETSADADIGHISGSDLGVHYTKHNLNVTCKEFAYFYVLCSIRKLSYITFDSKAFITVYM